MRYGRDEYTDVACVIGHGIEDPCSIEKALDSELSEEWKAAPDLEYKSLMDNHTLELVQLPKDRKSVGCRWIFKMKCGSNG